MQRLSWRARLILAALRSSGVIIGVISPLAHADVMQTYDWAPGSTITGKNSVQAAITGGFVWDVTNETLVSVNTLMTNLDTSVQIDHLTIAGPQYTTQNMVFSAANGDFLQIFFTFNLGATPAPVGSIFGNQIGDFGGPDSVASWNMTANPVPESSTYALMLSGLGFLGFAALRRKQNRRN